MTFVSYAQNYEDVILWRMLNQIKNGFYVDVGAYDPETASVTKAFYERGWRGINIEPVRYWYDRLVLECPEDINLNMAISDEPGSLSMYNVLGTGLSTFDKLLAERYREQSAYEIQDITVPVYTLDNILEKYAINKDIHFLKVDVEGLEKQVFNSIDLTRTRPWIILTEITYIATWETLLTDHNYDFMYFDGLNNFYLAKERSEYRPAFNAPPNVFDSFVRASEVSLQNIQKNLEKQLEDKNSELQSGILSLQARNVQLQAIKTELQTRETELQARETELQARETELQALYNSHSWQITVPFRKMSSFIKKRFSR